MSNDNNEIKPYTVVTSENFKLPEEKPTPGVMFKSEISEAFEPAEAEDLVTPEAIEQFEKWHREIMKKVQRLFYRQSKYMRDNNQTTDGLLLFLDKYPALFADYYEEINRDIIKWALNENIKKNRLLIDKIQEIEDSLGLEMHHRW